MSPNAEQKIHHEGTKGTKNSTNMAGRSSRRDHLELAQVAAPIRASASKARPSQVWTSFQGAFLRVLRAFVVNLLTLMSRSHA